MTGTWTTLELRKALEMGYVIDHIYAATPYTGVKGLINDYVMRFLRMKICNNKPTKSSAMLSTNIIRGSVSRSAKT